MTGRGLKRLTEERKRWLKRYKVSPEVQYDVCVNEIHRYLRKFDDKIRKKDLNSWMKSKWVRDNMKIPFPLFYQRQKDVINDVLSNAKNGSSLRPGLLTVTLPMTTKTDRSSEKLPSILTSVQSRPLPQSSIEIINPPFNIESAPAFVHTTNSADNGSGSEGNLEITMQNNNNQSEDIVVAAPDSLPSSSSSNEFNNVCGTNRILTGSHQSNGRISKEIPTSQNPNSLGRIQDREFTWRTINDIDPHIRSLNEIFASHSELNFLVLSLDDMYNKIMRVHKKKVISRPYAQVHRETLLRIKPEPAEANEFRDDPNLISNIFPQNNETECIVVNKHTPMTYIDMV